MNKRDTIIVVFRVVAIFVLFSSIAMIPNIILEWMESGFISGSTSTKIIRTIIEMGVPITIVFLLWNESNWIADKILQPFGMDELWEDVPPEEISEDGVVLIPEPEIIPESTITHLNRDEIESIILMAIGVWVLADSIPQVLHNIIAYILYHGIREDIANLAIVPFAKSLIGCWLLFRTEKFRMWVHKIRTSRIQE